MPGNRFNAFQNHGVGIGLRIPHYQHIFSRKPVVDWFEIISENFMIDGGRPLAMLDQILERYRVVQHGVSMYFGSVTEPDPEHLQAAQDTGSPHRHSLAQRSSLLGLGRRHLHPRPAPAALHLGGRRAHRRARPQGAGLPRNSRRRRKRQLLRRLHRLADDRVGVPDRSGRARRLRHSARRQQHLRLVGESRIRSDGLRERRARRIAWRRFTSPATRATRSTSSTPTTIRSSIRCGSSTRAPSSAAAPRPRCSSGTTTFPASTKSTPKP